ncbi:rhamnogalacturonan lyase B N-terminal domain-containing protein [Roseateles sp. LYH14W]|uniref:rhamnogalacturonan endolyase n=1 Tax=Pelomonas parva TaxID=3299032 RepID=A0ABW7FB87_9BURK
MNFVSHGRLAALGLAAAACTFSSTAALAAWGITDASGVLTVDSGAGLVFKVNKSSGDITSIKLNNGAELQGQTKFSHISSGLGAPATYAFSPSGTTAVITITAATLKHYLVVRRNENTIYMATHVTAEPAVGELRWITRLNGSVFTGVPVESNLRGNTGAIESADIFGMSDGTTRSKYYGNQRAKDMGVRGVTGSGVGVFMVYGNRESASGGPFFRDIQNQSGADTELYNYMNSGHNQTEAFRMGLHGPYALVFTTGATPAAPDMSWMSGLGLQGWVSGRGKVVLNGLTGMDTAYAYTVGFANGTAQHWGTASGSGAVTVANMKPGTYTMTVYKGELGVFAEQVSVASGGTTTLNTRAITADPSQRAVLWRVGNWDGTPLEFLNGQTFTVRHPQDTRNPSWGPVTYAVGSATNKFPGAIWKDKNDGTKITFNLTSAQLAARTVRIGITAAYANARPQITVNGWTSAVPSPSTQPNSRSLTLGTYRGNNTTFTYSVPASAFVAGTNTVTINAASGSGSAGFLSAGFAVDAVDMY